MTTSKPVMDENAARRVLDATATFHDVPTDVLDAVAAAARPRRFEADAGIFELGDPSDGIYVVARGSVGITSLFTDGKEIVLNILESHQVFGEVGAVDGLPRTASALAMEPTEVLHIEGDVFRRLIRLHPELCHGIMSVLCSRVRWTSNVIEDTVFRDTRTRLAKRLLMLADLYGRETKDGIQLGMKFSQEHLGRMLGVTRESVSKEGGQTAFRRAVSFKHGVITIHDRTYLEELAALS